MLADLAVAHDIGAKLDAMGIAWVVVGSVASSLFGEPRAATDVDLVADLQSVHVRAFCRLIEDDYRVDEDTARWAASTRRCFDVIHQSTITKIDIFCCKDDPLSLAQLQRRVFEQVAGKPMPSLSPEDSILQKLRWPQEPGVSEQHWSDALGVLRVRWAMLDREYLDAQARDNGLGELLHKLIAERDPS